MQNQTITNNVKVPSKDLNILKKNFSNCFDKNGDFDFDKFKKELSKNKDIDFSNESYAMDWLGKSYARLLASDEAKTLFKEEKEWNNKKENKSSGNLLIKGDNLEVLKHLSNAYYESIKMIYIDPPYNTGSDGFVYEDDRKFTVEELSKLAGVDEEKAKRILNFTQSKSNSHSAWLTFMYPRLYIAKQLLKDDGVIFVSIDDNEVAQLRLLMDEIFGEENFVTQLVWKTRQASGKQVSENNVSVEHEYVLVYQTHKIIFKGVSRNRSSYTNPDNDPRGDWAKHPLDVGSTKDERPNCFYDLIDPDTGNVYHANPNRVWAFSPESMKRLLDEKKILFDPAGKRKPYLKKFWMELKSDSKPVSSWLDQKLFKIKYNTEGTKHVNKLFNGNKIFDYPKPTSLLKILINQVTDSTDIILDFFAGSGTTGDAVMQLNTEDGENRKYILVQLPEQIYEKKNKTAYDFVKNELKIENPTIFEITKERLVRSAKKIQEDNKKAKEVKDLSNIDFGFKIFETTPIWEDYNIEAENFDSQMELFDESRLTKEDLETLLTTWKTYDGFLLTQDLNKIDLDGYTAYYLDNKLYLMNKGFETKNLKKLLEEIDANKGFNPASIIVFGYNFQSKILREIADNVKNYANKKQIEIDLITRY